MSGFADRRFQDALIAKLESTYGEHLGYLVTAPAKTFDEYRFQQGGLQMLLSIRAWVDEINKEMNDTRRD